MMAITVPIQTMVSIFGKDFGSPFQASSQASLVRNIHCSLVGLFLCRLDHCRCENGSGSGSGGGSGHHFSYDGPVDESDFDMRMCYLMIQIGLIFVLSSTSLALFILTCRYKPTAKTNQGKKIYGLMIMN